MGRLRAVAAVLWTAASLHRVKKTLLDVLTVVMIAMLLMSLVQQLEKGLTVQVVSTRGGRLKRVGGIAHSRITPRREPLNNLSFLFHMIIE